MDRVCRQCGATLQPVPPGVRGKTPAFCGDECRIAARKLNYKTKADSRIRIAVCKLCEVLSEMPKGKQFCPICLPLKGKEIYRCPGCGRCLLMSKYSRYGVCVQCKTANGARAVNNALAGETRECRHCGQSFTPQIPVQAFCSPACNNKHWSQRKRNARRAAFIEDVPLGYIFERDGGTCQICSLPVDRSLKFPHPQSATIDHILPVEKGGEHSKRNCQLAHFACNSSKGACGVGCQQLLIG